MFRHSLARHLVGRDHRTSIGYLSLPPASPVGMDDGKRLIHGLDEAVHGQSRGRTPKQALQNLAYHGGREPEHEAGQDGTVDLGPTPSIALQHLGRVKAPGCGARGVRCRRVRSADGADSCPCAWPWRRDLRASDRPPRPSGLGWSRQVPDGPAGGSPRPSPGRPLASPSPPGRPSVDSRSSKHGVATGCGDGVLLLVVSGQTQAVPLSRHTHNHVRHPRVYSVDGVCPDVLRILQYPAGSVGVGWAV